MSWVAMSALSGHSGGWGMNMMEEVWRKGPWTSEEDRLLTEYVRLHGEGRWNSVARLTGLKRNGKSCRLRWVNYLRPDLKRGQITPHEEKVILELHTRWGNRWSTIARSLPGRTDNEIKNYWRTHFKKGKGCLGSSEKVKNARLLRRQQFHQQYQQQQQQVQQQQMQQQQMAHQAEQQMQLNHQVDVKKINSIMSLVNGLDSIVPYAPQLRQETGTICNTITFEGQYSFESSMSDCYGSVQEAWNNEDFAWEGLWN